MNETPAISKTILPSSGRLSFRTFDAIRIPLLLFGLAWGLNGCALPQEVTKTPRSAIEQLLLSQAVERAMEMMVLPLPEGESMRVEISGLQTDRAHLHMDEAEVNFGIIDSPSWDLAFVRDLVAGRLGELGYLIRKRDEDVKYMVRILVQAMGTNQGKTFFGMPPVQSVLIPFSLPALTLYQEIDQYAHARFHLEVFEAATGRFVRATPWLVGNTYYNQYTVFFFFSFRTTDLTDPPPHL